MNVEQYFVEKELSWLSFNERVLQEAGDRSVPIVERIRFLGIYSNNMDEFFRVRVADVKRRVVYNKKNTNTDDNPEKLLTDIQSKVMRLQRRFHSIYREILVGLRKKHIYLVSEQQLEPEGSAFVESYFRSTVLPILAPVLLHENKSLPLLKDHAIYLAVKLTKQRKDRVNSHFALIEVPCEELPRFVLIPSADTKRKTLIILDNVIRHCLSDVFKGIISHDTVEAYTVKLTRDAELELGDGISQSYLDQMSAGLRNRHFGKPVRFVYDQEMPDDMLDFFMRKLELSNYDSLIPGERYHNFKDFIGFPNLGRATLENKPLPPMRSNQFDNYPSIFKAIRHNDILLHYPYHRFDYMTDFLWQAAIDPKVTSIMLSIYRVASNSKIVHSLVNAARNHKKVTVVVELQARFDEKANIKWARKLTDEGVKVEFGVPGLKVHSKLCLVKCIENNQEVSYAHIGTGNFHEKTAKIYTDFSLFTYNQAITQEVEKVFDFIHASYQRYEFRHLVVSPLDCRERINAMLIREIENAKAGKDAWCIFKVNNLVDKALAALIYRASQAGVKVNLIVRGMCCIQPGIKGLSDNIRAISIVDRFLEHPRIMAFCNDGDEEVYISSADLMTRNIEHRVEVGVPIYDETLKKRVLDILHLQLADNTKARIIDPEQKNDYVKKGRRRKIRSQFAIYDYVRNWEEEIKLTPSPAAELSDN
tara:strand:- start:3137 stop:5245 length:2109 start_codon:yes stop_codon:yes gene_type:complete